MPSLYILIAIILWSSLGIFVRLAGVDVHLIIFYSSAFSILYQSVLFTRRGFRQSIPPLRRFPFIFIISVCLLLNTFTFFFAYSKTTISNAVLTHYVAPIVVAVLAAVFLGERITLRIILSIVIASAGLWIMLGGETILACLEGITNQGIKFTPNTLGVLSGLLSGIFYAVLVILVRVFTQRINPYVMVFFQNLFIVLMLLPFAAPLPLNKLWVFAVMGAVHSTAAPYLYYRGLQSVMASRAAVLGYLEPVGAIIFSILLLGEMSGIASYIGGGLIILSGYMTIKEGRLHKA